MVELVISQSHDVGLQLVDEIDDGCPLEEREVRRALECVSGHQEQGRQAALVGQSPLVFHEIGDPREPPVAPAQRRVVLAALVAVQVRLVEPAVHVVGVEQHQFQAGRVGRDRSHCGHHDGQTRGGYNRRSHRVDCPEETHPRERRWSYATLPGRAALFGGDVPPACTPLLSPGYCSPFAR